MYNGHIATKLGKTFNNQKFTQCKHMKVVDLFR